MTTGEVFRRLSTEVEPSLIKWFVVRRALRLMCWTVQCAGLVPQPALCGVCLCIWPNGYALGHRLPCAPYVDVTLCRYRTLGAAPCPSTFFGDNSETSP